MTAKETHDIKEAVKEAVNEQLPETLGETLSPMITHTVRQMVRPFHRAIIVGYILLAVAFGVLYWKQSNVSDTNTLINHRQDCLLAGLIRGIEIGDKDPSRVPLYTAALGTLDAKGRCPELITKGGRP